MDRDLIMDKAIAQSHECLSSCLENILNRGKKLISGNEIIINGGGLRIVYDETENKLTTKMYDANFIFLKKNHIELNRIKCNQSINSEEYLDNLLKTNQNIIIKVDAELLTYNRIFRQAYHTPHFINIYKKMDDFYTIYDGYVPTREGNIFSGPVEKNILFRAWEKEHRFVYTLNDIPDIDEKRLLRNTLEELQKSIVIYCNGGKKKNKWFGKDALKGLSNMIMNGIDKETAYEINFQLKIWGFISTKKMIYDFISKLDFENEILVEYKRLIEEWYMVCLILIKSTLSKYSNQKTKLLVKIIDCIEKEDALLKRINDALSCKLDELMQMEE